MIVRTFLIAALSLLVMTAPAAAASVVLRGLDKTSGHTKDFAAPIGKHVQFGTLDIVARTCAKRPPEETPEIYAFLEISDSPIVDADKPKVAEQKLFSGWMMWSSPALNALEHPSYDVWVIDCKS